MMRVTNLKHLIFGLAALTLAGCASRRRPIEAVAAAPPPAAVPGDAGLDDYLAAATARNPGIAAARGNWDAAKERAPQVGALPDPEVSLGVFLREVETRVGPQRYRVGLSQKLPEAGKRRLGRRVATAAAKAARSEIRSKVDALRYKVKKAYYELAYLERAIAITGKNIRLLSFMEKVARTRYKTGVSVYGDVIRAQVELGELENRLASMKDLRRPWAARLDEALDRPASTRLPRPGAITDPGELAVDEATLATWIAGNNPSVEALDALDAKEAARIHLARRASRPDMMVGLSYIGTGSALNPGVRDSGKDPVLATVAWTLPLRRAKYRAGEREALARRRAVRKRRAAEVDALGTELALALYGFRDAGRKRDLYMETLVPKADQALAAIQQSFAAGRASFSDFIDAQRTRLELSLANERALADRVLALARIEWLCGRQVPTTLVKEVGHEH